MTLRRAVLVRHGETEWSRSGRHTGRTDVPLTEAGRHQAALVATRLVGADWSLVLTSPRWRAVETCRLAGLGTRAAVDDDLAEWDYGDYEGRTTADIRAERPGWWMWRDGCPAGEDAAAVAARVDRVLERIRGARGDVAVFAHGHLLRVMGARWVGADPAWGAALLLSTASISVLGWEHEAPVLAGWNDTAHLDPTSRD